MPVPKRQHLERVHGERGDDSALNVVFVHGLGSDGVSAWTNRNVEPPFYWPLALADEYPQICVWQLSYAANQLEIFSTKTWRALPLQDRAASVLNLLVTERIADKPIVFIAHSLGGLLVKQVLQLAQFLGPPDWRKVWMNTQAVFFLATPHQGAALSDFCERVLATVAGRNILARRILALSPAMRDLKRDNPLLRYLLLWYSANAEKAGIKTISFFETSDVAGTRVVCAGSAGAQSLDGELIPIEADHIGVSKPSDRRHPVYATVSEYIRSAIEHLERGTTRPVFRQSAVLGHPKLNDIPLFAGDGDSRLRRVKRVTHDVEAICRDRRFDISADDRSRAEGSTWDIDRVILYIADEYAGIIDINEPQRYVQREYELLKSTDINEDRGVPSTIPLYYAARSMDRLTEGRALSARTRQDLEIVLSFLQKHSRALDRDGAVKRTLMNVIGRCATPAVEVDG